MRGLGQRSAAAAGGATSFAVVGLLVAWAAWGPAASPLTPSHEAGAETYARAPMSSGPVIPARRAAAPAEVPTRSVLPDGVVVSIQPVDTAADGRLDVPDDVRVAGWWRGGARLGDPFGSTLIVGHVDSVTQGLGPFAGLLSVRPGQHISLSSAHLTQTFTVAALALVPRGTLSSHPRIFSARGPRRLTLVTCAGPYDASRGGYQNLAVITARQVAEPEKVAR